MQRRQNAGGGFYLSLFYLSFVNVPLGSRPGSVADQSCPIPQKFRPASDCPGIFGAELMLFPAPPVVYAEGFQQMQRFFSIGIGGISPSNNDIPLFSDLVSDFLIFPIPFFTPPCPPGSCHTLVWRNFHRYPPYRSYHVVSPSLPPRKGLLALCPPKLSCDNFLGGGVSVFFFGLSILPIFLASKVSEERSSKKSSMTMHTPCNACSQKCLCFGLHFVVRPSIPILLFHYSIFSSSTSMERAYCYFIRSHQVFISRKNTRTLQEHSHSVIPLPDSVWLGVGGDF